MSNQADNIIFQGADIQGVQISFHDDNGCEANLSQYQQITLTLIDKFNVSFAQYIFPYTEQVDYYELNLIDDHILAIDIHKEDSIDFRIGDLFANVVFEQTNDDFTDNYQPAIHNILIGEVQR